MTNSFFITGCVRSGTTLVEKLLCNHPKLSVLSQPMPMLYIRAKQAFLQEKKIEEYFALSNYVNEKRYSFTEFDAYLSEAKFSKYLVKDAITSDFSGRLTASLSSELANKDYLSVIYNHLMKINSHNENASFFGSKEVLCEEFVPYFIRNNTKVIHIIRDPLDVVSSIKNGKGGQYIGNVKPLLFELRNWRKSAQLAIQCQNHENFLWLRYEDLVLNTKYTLEKICNFLNIENFDENVFKESIKDQDGKVWSANSSFGNNASIISTKSIGRYKQLLSQETINYVMSICLPELLALGLTEKSEGNHTQVIDNFIEPIQVNDSHFSSDYSTSECAKKYEIKRLSLFNRAMMTPEINYLSR